MQENAIVLVAKATPVINVLAQVKSMHGVDIDEELITRAQKHVRYQHSVHHQTVRAREHVDTVVLKPIRAIASRCGMRFTDDEGLDWRPKWEFGHSCVWLMSGELSARMVRRLQGTGETKDFPISFLLSMGPLPMALAEQDTKVLPTC
jgi:hypothetical protein